MPAIAANGDSAIGREERCWDRRERVPTRHTLRTSGMGGEEVKRGKRQQPSPNKHRSLETHTQINAQFGDWKVKRESSSSTIRRLTCRISSSNSVGLNTTLLTRFSLASRIFPPPGTESAPRAVLLPTLEPSLGRNPVWSVGLDAAPAGAVGRWERIPVLICPRLEDEAFRGFARRPWDCPVRVGAENLRLQVVGAWHTDAAHAQSSSPGGSIIPVHSGGSGAVAALIFGSITTLGICHPAVAFHWLSLSLCLSSLILSFPCFGIRFQKWEPSRLRSFQNGFQSLMLSAFDLHSQGWIPRTKP